jgi:agmatine deiminase
MTPLHFEITTDSCTVPDANSKTKIDTHDAEQPGMRMPGEFEPQDAIVVGCSTLVQDAPQVFLNIVRALYRRIQLIGLVDSESRQTLGRMLLATAGLPQSAIQLVRVSASSMWVRDFGPTTVIDDRGGRRFLDFDRRHLRPSNVHTATEQLASILGVPRLPVNLSMAGGNLLSNGDDVCLTSSTVILQNSQEDGGIEQIGVELCRYLGAKRWAYVSPLPGERTGHVDLICTFVSRDTLVVGKADPVQDADYAQRLDKVADHLARVQTRTGPLRVVRIPMPSSRDTHSRSYTNVVFANGTLLVPLYPETDGHRDRIAMEIYSRLLPDWEIVGIDVSSFSHLNGALHCLTCNIPSAAPVRNIPSASGLVDPTPMDLAAGEAGLI